MKELLEPDQDSGWAGLLNYIVQAMFSNIDFKIHKTSMSNISFSHSNPPHVFPKPGAMLLLFLMLEPLLQRQSVLDSLLGMCC